MFFRKKKPQPQPKPPLLIYAEIPLSGTERCSESIRDIAAVHYGDQVLSFRQAIDVYYSCPDIALPWEFPVKDVVFEPYHKSYTVYGDGINLGFVSYSKYSSHNVRLIEDLLATNSIQKTRCEIKDSSYFHLTQSEYERYVTNDPYNKGYAKWATDRSPEITLFVYFYSGVLDLKKYDVQDSFPDPDEFK